MRELPPSFEKQNIENSLLENIQVGAMIFIPLREWEAGGRALFLLEYNNFFWEKSEY